MSADQNIHETMGERWEFNEAVVDVFDEMLQRSIPQYETMRRTVYEIGRRFARDGEPGIVLDLGCSRGEAMAPFVESGWQAVGYEVSAPMLAASRERFADTPRVQIFKHDLREKFTAPLTDVVLAVLTLIFTPINHRQRIVRDAYESLRPGGAMIVVEKVLAHGADLDRLMVDVYHESKIAAGYSREEVDRKALALEGVQVPVTREWNLDLLRSAGFAEVDTFWQWCNFCGFIGVKR